MSTPRWFTIAGSVLLLNLGLVVCSVIWRQASADDGSQKSEQAVADNASLDVPAVNTLAEVGLANEGSSTGTNAEAQIAKPNEPLELASSAKDDASEPLPGKVTDSQEPPAANSKDNGSNSDQRLFDVPEMPGLPKMPEVPSLADPKDLERDPVYQELRQMFSSQNENLTNDAPPTMNPEASKAAYIASLQQRFETVEQLLTSARTLTDDAARLDQVGKTKQVEDLLRIVVQLRDMSAQLLVGEL